MIRSAAGKVMWVGRATVFLVGLAVILALVFGVATTALGANGDFFKVGRLNVASAVSTLDKSGAGPALRLLVDSGAPLAVNSTTKVARLNADRIDDREASSFANGVGGVATNADKLDSLDSGDFVTRGQFSNVPSGVVKHPLNFHSYFMDTTAVQDYPFGQMKLQTTGTPGQFKVCHRSTGLTGQTNFVVYVNGVRTAGTYSNNGGCSAVFDAGAGGEFRVSARRAQVFGVHSGDSTTNENYSLMGFDQLG